jgi:hypothetical protein
MQRQSGEPIIAIERVLLWLILTANGAATIFLIVVLLRHPSPASLVPSGLIDGLMLVVGWIAGVGPSSEIGSGVAAGISG